MLLLIGIKFLIELLIVYEIDLFMEKVKEVIPYSVRYYVTNEVVDIVSYFCAVFFAIFLVKSLSKNRRGQGGPLVLNHDDIFEKLRKNVKDIESEANITKRRPLDLFRVFPNVLLVSSIIALDIIKINYKYTMDNYSEFSGTFLLKILYTTVMIIVFTKLIAKIITDIFYFDIKYGFIYLSILYPILFGSMLGVNWYTRTNYTYYAYSTEPTHNILLVGYFANICVFKWLFFFFLSKLDCWNNQENSDSSSSLSVYYIFWNFVVYLLWVISSFFIFLFIETQSFGTNIKTQVVLIEVIYSFFLAVKCTCNKDNSNFILNVILFISKRMYMTKSIINLATAIISGLVTLGGIFCINWIYFSYTKEMRSFDYLYAGIFITLVICVNTVSIRFSTCFTKPESKTVLQDVKENNQPDEVQEEILVEQSKT